eukprot:225712-Pyramimonas_sp.AAC.1
MLSFWRPPPADGSTGAGTVETLVSSLSSDAGPEASTTAGAVDSAPDGITHPGHAFAPAWGPRRSGAARLSAAGAPTAHRRLPPFPFGRLGGLRQLGARLRVGRPVAGAQAMLALVDLA